jgi:hypothetical protein
MAAKQGPNVLFCMPNRTNCVLTWPVRVPGAVKPPASLVLSTCLSAAAPGPGVEEPSATSDRVPWLQLDPGAERDSILIRHRNIQGVRKKAALTAHTPAGDWAIAPPDGNAFTVHSVRSCDVSIRINFFLFCMWMWGHKSTHKQAA